MVCRTLSMDLTGRRVRDSTTVHYDCLTSGEPEHSSPRCHHDTGGQQLVV